MEATRVPAEGAVVFDAWLSNYLKDPVTSRGPRGVQVTCALRPGTTFDWVVRNRPRVAAHLDVALERLLVAPAGAGAALTVLDSPPAVAPRLCSVPLVRDGGELVGVGGYVDGVGEPSVSAWTRRGAVVRTVPLALVGRPGVGRSNVLRVLTSTMLRAMPMNLMVIDPSGCRDTELQAHGAVVLSGRKAARWYGAVLAAIMASRAERLATAGGEGEEPTRATPCWMVVFTDVGATMSDGSVSEQAMLACLRDADRLGMWPVAVAGSLAIEDWGSERVRDAFGAQVVAFAGATQRTIEGTLGVDMRCASLPEDENGRPIPGYAMLNFGPRRNVPLRFDCVPGTGDGPLTDDERATRDALVELVPRAQVNAFDRDAIASVLGEPGESGRWYLGDREATALNQRWLSGI